MECRSRVMRYAVTVSILALLLAVSVLPVHGAKTTGSKYVFYEKFTSDNPRQWNVQTLSDGSATSLSRGAYTIYRAHPGTMRGWPLQVRVPTGVQFNVRLQLQKGTDPYEGIAFWDDLANSFTLFAITPDGYAGLFRHTRKGYAVVMDWRPVASVHRGRGAVNSISINLDRLSGALGRTFLINGVPLGKRCNDTWRRALGTAPTAPKRGLYVGVVAGSYKGSSKVAVQLASMYDGTAAGPVPQCKSVKA